ncbi:hypothetical protein [Sphingobacterium siyangense]|uniref:hypothetical protein n=1 Tax=Sphingobacterium siyangense TaxID=459529 RepID=UPI003DA68051
MPIIINSEYLDHDYLLKFSVKGFFNDFTPSTVPSRMNEIIKISSDHLSLKLIDKNQNDLLSFVHGNFITYNNIEYFEIKSAYSKLKKMGLLTYLFKLLIYEFGYKILSDSKHSTPGSKEFWQSHIKRKDFMIYRLNLATNHKRKASRYKENLIWFEKVPEPLYPIYFINEEFNDDIQEIEDLDTTLVLEEIDGMDIEVEDYSAEKINISNSKIRLVAQKFVK